MTVPHHIKGGNSAIGYTLVVMIVMAALFGKEVLQWLLMQLYNFFIW